MNNSLSKIWWIGVPCLIAFVQLCIELFAAQALMAELHSERGSHEFIEFLFIGAAFLVAVSILTKLNFKTQKKLVLWTALAATCCLYVAGEEVSWGQHFLKWSTPEYWAHINDQHETNFHNTSSWLDQKPRLLLLIGIVIGGIIIPFLRKVKPGLVPEKMAIIYPPAVLGVTAVFAVSANLIDKIFEAIAEAPLLSRGSEVEELYLFYFVLLYMIILRRRVMQQ